MADEQIANGDHRVQLDSPGVTTASGQSHSPIIVSSGSRPLQISSSPVDSISVDGVAETKSPSTSITVFPAAASPTPVQSTVTPSGGGIVIRAASSNSTQQQAPVTSPSTFSGTPIAVSSGITIRSSASVPSSPPVITNTEGPTRDVKTTISGSPKPTINPATTESPAIVITPNSVATVNLLPVNDISYQKAMNNDPVAVTFTESAPVAHSSVTSSPQITLSAPKSTAAATGIIDQTPRSQPSNGVRQSSPEIGSVNLSPSPSVIRAASSISSRSRPSSAVFETPRQPPMTWSELTNRFDLVTICGFTLAILAVAFSSILIGDDLPFGWLLAGISTISVGVFVKLSL